MSRVDVLFEEVDVSLRWESMMMRRDVGGVDGEVCGWAAFHMHFSVGISAGGRANMIAAERG